MKIGSLFTGYGGLDLGVELALGGQPAWFSEKEPGPSRILNHHWPDVPNLGDVTKIDWADVEPVDIMTGGSPCQDVSAAGRRAGMRSGTRSGLWAAMVDAIDALKPSIVIWENVRGVTSACADSGMGQCPRCMGRPGQHQPVLRALGRVLGDLADLGYDAEWTGIRASDVGAPHQRYRIFVVAADTSSASRWWSGTDTRQGDHGTGNGPRDRDLTAAHADHAGLERAEPATGRHLPARGTDWGKYAAAISRWEHVLGRPAPVPVEPNTKDGLRHTPEFVEWMMGLPAGHVTDPAIGLSRNEQLVALGNGVVPQQAAAAIVECVARRRYPDALV